MAYNALPVKPCAVMTLDKQKTLISIGFTGLLATGRFFRQVKVRKKSVTLLRLLKGNSQNIW